MITHTAHEAVLDLSRQIGISLSHVRVEERLGGLALRASYSRLVPPKPWPEAPEGFSGWDLGRQAEFAAGRVLASAALAVLGLPARLPRAASRAPEWPLGASGAISHTHSEVGALVVPGLWRVGLDIQDIAQGESLSALRSEALSIADRQVLAPVSTEAAVADTLGFCAKETLFKALHPEVQRVFGFDAARVVEVEGDGLTLELTRSLTDELDAGTRFDLTWSLDAGAVETWMIDSRVV
ncbi:4'-phosphopantetheinyl transferase family protein [Pseudaestuariivita sp.]|uniref:4'-phosphopantetheinyl transferase family protein n=1 Tax=Pseudaestuariivita sp. TaxID=2211669 RepID=UPI0040591EE1